MCKSDTALQCQTFFFKSPMINPVILNTILKSKVLNKVDYLQLSAITAFNGEALNFK